MIRKRTLGRTGFQVTEVGLGGIPIMRVDFDQAARIVHHALDRGMNYLDNARAYGDSEAKFGQVMRERRDECFLATKTNNYDRAGAEQHLQESLEALQTDHLDLWQMHDVSTSQRWEQVMGPDGALQAARQAQARGQVRFVGLTGHGIPVLQKAIESGEFDVVLCVYNLGVFDTAEPVLAAAHAANVGVAIMKPLSGGIFFHHLKAAEGELQITPEIAWRFVLSNPHLSVALAGTEELRDIDQAVEASAGFVPLSAEEARPYQQQAVALGEDACRDCRYCRDCPADIEVWTIMQLLDRARVYSYEWPKFRQTYAALATKADACTDCGQCEEACPFDLPIRERLRKAHAQFNEPV